MEISARFLRRSNNLQMDYLSKFVRHASDYLFL